MTELLIITLAASIAGVTLMWLLSLYVGRVSIIDAYWGPGFVILTGVCSVWRKTAPGSVELTSSELSQFPLTSLALVVSLWGLRLGAHLSRRVFRERHEDRRYASIRSRHERGWKLRSLVIVFWLQGVIMWLISIPITSAFSSLSTPARAPLIFAGVIVWSAGFFFETVGDWQLSRFRANPDNRGRVLSTGLWGFTRHPNYFGDFAVWWGIWLIATGAGASYWTVFSPVLMSFFLMKLSGVALLEKDIAERRPEYGNYIRTTNAFFPGPRRNISSP